MILNDDGNIEERRVADCLRTTTVVACGVHGDYDGRSSDVVLLPVDESASWRRPRTACSHAAVLPRRLAGRPVCDLTVESG